MHVTPVDSSISPGSLLDVIEVIQSDAPLVERRLSVGKQLLQLLQAQVFVSYIHGSDGPFLDPIDVNMGEESLSAYDEHFRNVDRITPVLFRRRGANRISLPADSKEEFIRDFLQRRNLHYGMNFFARSPALGKVDLRIWRDRDAGPFTESDVRLLDGVGGLIERLWDSSSAKPGIRLTPREIQVAEMVTAGLSDKQICSRLHMALSTLRTHLRNIYDKVGVQNRAGLAAYHARHRH